MTPAALLGVDAKWRFAIRVHHLGEVAQDFLVGAKATCKHHPQRLKVAFLQEFENDHLSTMFSQSPGYAFEETDEFGPSGFDGFRPLLLRHRPLPRQGGRPIASALRASPVSTWRSCSAPRHQPCDHSRRLERLQRCAELRRG